MTLPGSTMKAVTIAAALDKGVVTPKTSYNDVGYAVIGGRVLSNAYGRVYGPTTVAQVLERSQNAGATSMSRATRLRLIPSRWSDALPRGQICAFLW